MTQETWNRIESQFSFSPILYASPSSREEVKQASRILGREFDPDHMEFMFRYGSGIVGAYPILGTRKAKAMGNDTWSVVEVTRHYRAQGWPGVSDWYLVSVDLAGNPIGLALDGSVWVSDHDVRETVQIANSFEDFIRNWCLRSPNTSPGSAG